MGRNTKTDSGTEFLKGIGIIIVGIFIIFGTADAVANSFKEPPSLYDLRTEELQVGEYVQEDLYAALDYFMYEETIRTKYGIEVSSRVSAYYYIIPVLSENKEELYMAVEVPASAEPEMYSICEDTLLLLSGRMKATQFGHNTYHVRGRLRNMKEEELQYMTEWFQETEFFGTTNATEIRKHIYPVMLQKDDTISSRIFMIMGFVFIIVGLFMVKGNSGVRRKKNEATHYESYSQQNTFQPYQPFQHDNPKPATDTYSSGNMQEYDSMFVPPNEKPANNLIRRKTRNHRLIHFHREVHSHRLMRFLREVHNRKMAYISRLIRNRRKVSISPKSCRCTLPCINQVIRHSQIIRIRPRIRNSRALHFIRAMHFHRELRNRRIPVIRQQVYRHRIIILIHTHRIAARNKRAVPTLHRICLFMIHPMMITKKYTISL